MAVEAKRGCGYRKVSGLYLVAGGIGVPCDRLPIPLDVCPCCGGGIKQSRGWTWVSLKLLLTGPNVPQCGRSRTCLTCPVCMETIDKAGLLWIGGSFYPTPEKFIEEAAAQGISRRIAAVPRNFKLGETWVLLAHAKTIKCSDCEGGGMALVAGTKDEVKKCLKCKGTGFTPGIFRVFKPQAIEKIVTESMFKNKEEMEKLEKAGVTPVVVPDDDKDHQGSVFDHEDADELQEVH